MNRLFIFTISCITIIISSCSSKYSIEGTANLGPVTGKQVFLKAFDKNGWTNVDSCQVIHGMFCLTGDINKNTPQIVTLFLDNIPITPLIVESGKINIELTTTSLSISGTPLNNKLYSFYEENQTLEQRAKLNTALLNKSDVNSFLANKHEELVKSFIVQNRNNALSPIILSIYKKYYPDLVRANEIKELYEDSTNSIIIDPEFSEIEALIDYVNNYPTDFLLW